MEDNQPTIYDIKLERLKRLSGIDLRNVTGQEFQNYLNRKKSVYIHAVLKVKETDDLAVEGWEIEQTFPKAVLSLFQSISEEYGFTAPEESEDRKSFLRTFDLRPDLFSINREKPEIIIHEIEDNHPLETHKLHKIHEAFQFCDEEGIVLRVFVYDRYGLNRRELDLWPLSLIVFDPRLFIAWTSADPETLIKK